MKALVRSVCPLTAQQTSVRGHQGWASSLSTDTMPRSQVYTIRSNAIQHDMIQRHATIQYDSISIFYSKKNPDHLTNIAAIKCKLKDLGQDQTTPGQTAHPWCQCPAWCEILQVEPHQLRGLVVSPLCFTSTSHIVATLLYCRCRCCECSRPLCSLYVLYELARHVNGWEGGGGRTQVRRQEVWSRVSLNTRKRGREELFCAFAFAFFLSFSSDLFISCPCDELGACSQWSLQPQGSSRLQHHRDPQCRWTGENGWYISYIYHYIG